MRRSVCKHCSSSRRAVAQQCSKHSSSGTLGTAKGRGLLSTKPLHRTNGISAVHALQGSHAELAQQQLWRRPCLHSRSSLLQACERPQQLSAKVRRLCAPALAATGSSSAYPQQPQPPAVVPPAQINPSNLPNIDPNSIDPNGLAGLFLAYAVQLQQAMAQEQQQTTAGSTGANVLVKNLGFHPPGAEAPLLDNVSFHLKPNQLGLIIGRSGSGKTTLLQLLAGLSEQTAGQVFIHRPNAASHASGLLVPTHIEERMQQVWISGRIQVLGPIAPFCLALVEITFVTQMGICLHTHRGTPVRY